LIVDMEMETHTSHMQEEDDIRDVQELWEMDVDFEYSIPVGSLSPNTEKLNKGSCGTRTASIMELYAMDLHIDSSEEIRNEQNDIDMIMLLYHTDCLMDGFSKDIYLANLTFHDANLLKEMYAVDEEIGNRMNARNPNEVHMFVEFADPMAVEVMMHQRLYMHEQARSHIHFSMQNIRSLWEVDLDVDGHLQYKNDMKPLLSLVAVDTEIDRSALKARECKEIADVQELYAMDIAVDSPRKCKEGLLYDEEFQMPVKGLVPSPIRKELDTTMEYKVSAKSPPGKQRTDGNEVSTRKSNFDELYTTDVEMDSRLGLKKEYDDVTVIMQLYEVDCHVNASTQTSTTSGVAASDELTIQALWMNDEDFNASSSEHKNVQFVDPRTEAIMRQKQISTRITVNIDDVSDLLRTDKVVDIVGCSQKQKEEMECLLPLLSVDSCINAASKSASEGHQTHDLLDLYAIDVEVDQSSHGTGLFCPEGVIASDSSTESAAPTTLNDNNKDVMSNEVSRKTEKHPARRKIFGFF